MTESASSTTGDSTPEVFQGFERPTANFIYCPNQLFDVCIATQPLGVVRLVAYILDRTLGWLDDKGNPIEQDIAVSYCELIERAGISRGAIRNAIEQAIAAGFIVAVSAGRPNESGVRATNACYRLNWDDGGRYRKSLDGFAGFYTGEGHRTAIPNSFFREIIPTQSLAIVKVVACVLRFTIGYENQFGHRRTSAPLSYSFIQNFTGIGSRTTLSNSILDSCKAGFIQCVESGTFAADRQKRKSATYAIRWRAEAKKSDNGTKTGPVKSERFKKWTSNGSQTGPAERYKNWTKEKTEEKDTDKQQEIAVAAEKDDSIKLLLEAGFEERIAEKIADSGNANIIRKQINWLPLRSASRNPLGLLRKAIEEDWPNPRGDRQPFEHRSHDRTPDDVAADVTISRTEKTSRLTQRQNLLSRWDRLTTDERSQFHQQAIDATTSPTVRRRLLTCRNLTKPPSQTLACFAETISHE